MTIRLVWTLWLLLVCAAPAWATDYYVDDGGSDGNNGLTVGAPKATVADVFDDYTLTGGDRIVLAPGSYTDADTCGGINAIFCLSDSGSSGNPIIIQATAPCVMTGTGTPSCPTVFDCNFTKEHVVIGNGGGDYVRLVGFEMRNCTHDAGNLNSTNIGIEFLGNWIHTIATTVCTAVDAPGRVGIYGNIASAGFIIAGNVFNDIGRNVIGESGCAEEPALIHYDHGIYLSGSGHRIYNNIFYDLTKGNSIQLYPTAASDIDIFNNTFRDSGSEGTAICQIILHLSGAGGSNIHIRNNLSDTTNSCFVMLTSGHTWSDVVISNNQTDLDISNQNESSPPSGVTFASNTIDTDPEWVNGAGGDFNLQTTSPAKDTGATLALTAVDLLGHVRPNGSAYDKGAVEFILVPGAPTDIKLDAPPVKEQGQ